MLRKLLFPVFIACLMLSSCAHKNENEEWSLMTDSLRYATLLNIARADSFVLVTINDPWTQKQVLHRYVLVPEASPMPKNFPEGTLLRTPLRRAIMHNAVHAALVEELGCAASIKGICDVEYVKSSGLCQLLESGTISDAGSSVMSDVERYIAMRTDAVFASPLEQNTYGTLEKARIPIVECADYMETSALGRAEWIRFFGLLFDCEERANQIFAQVERDYLQFRDAVQGVAKRPRLMVDMQSSSAWNMPGGKSYLGQLFSDAGADYVLVGDDSSGSVPLSFEQAYQYAVDADVWLIKNARTGGLSYEILKREQPSSAKFAPWKKRTVFFCNTLANDYYERIPYHPEILLRELAHIFHPDCFTDTLTSPYFLPLK